MVKTIVASFDGYHSAQNAVRALIEGGFMSCDIGVVASNVQTGQLEGVSRDTADRERSTAADDSASGAVTGGVMGGVAGLAASLVALAIPGIGPIIAAGPAVALLGGAGAGAVAGGLIGALTETGVAADHASYYAETIRRGGALVIVRVDASRSERAAAIMRDHSAIDLDERVARWREAGWDGWNPAGLPFTQDEAERERWLYEPNGAPDTSELSPHVTAHGRRPTRGDE